MINIVAFQERVFQNKLIAYFSKSNLRHDQSRTMAHLLKQKGNQEETIKDILNNFGTEDNKAVVDSIKSQEFESILRIHSQKMALIESPLFQELQWIRQRLTKDTLLLNLQQQQSYDSKAHGKQQVCELYLLDNHFLKEKKKELTQIFRPINQDLNSFIDSILFQRPVQQMLRTLEHVLDASQFQNLSKLANSVRVNKIRDDLSERKRDIQQRKESLKKASIKLKELVKQITMNTDSLIEAVLFQRQEEYLQQLRDIICANQYKKIKKILNSQKVKEVKGNLQKEITKLKEKDICELRQSIKAKDKLLQQKQKTIKEIKGNLQKEITKLKEIKGNLQKEITKLKEKDICELRQSIKAKDKLLQQKQKTIKEIKGNLQKEITKLKEIKGNLQKEITKLKEKDICELRQSIKAKDKLLQQKQKTIKEIKGNLQKEITKLKEIKGNLQKEITKLKEKDICELRQSIKAKDKLLQQKQKTIKEIKGNLQKEITKLKEIKGNLQKEITKLKEKDICELRQSIKAKDKLLQQKQKTIKEIKGNLQKEITKLKEKDICELRQSIKAKDKLLQQKQKTIKEIKGNLQKEITKLKEIKGNLQKEITKLKEKDICELRQSIKAKDKLLQQKQKTIKEIKGNLQKEITKLKEIKGNLQNVYYQFNAQKEKSQALLTSQIFQKQQRNLDLEVQNGIFPHLVIKQTMNLRNQQREKKLIYIFQQIQSLYKSKRLNIDINMIKDGLTVIYVKQQYMSAKLIQEVRNIRDLLLKQISVNNLQYLREHVRPNAYLSLGITSEILRNGQAESEYRRGLSYDQIHPQINLSLALLLYHRQRYSEALEYISKVTVKTAFTEKHRINIWGIFIGKVDDGICQQLHKANNSSQKIAKVQFVRKLMKFKEAFLYHCAEIQSLSQLSYASLAWLLLNTNRFSDSLTLTYKLKNLNQPGTEEIQQSLTNLYFRFSKFEESAQCAKQGLRANPRNEQMHQLLILSLMSLQQFPEAKVCAMGLLNTNKYNSIAYQTMGRILSIQGSKALALDYTKLGVFIQPSERTYLLLALQFSVNNNFAQAQRCYLKSIKIKPNEHNYSFLGIMYYQNNVYLNAIICFCEAITHNYLHFEPYLYLGLCAKRNKFFRSLINSFINKLRSSYTEDPFLQINLAAYKFISNKFHKQMYVFLGNFMKERKKGCEETLQSDIADQIIRFGLPKQIINECIIFSLMFGVLHRAKEQRIEANRIFVILIAQQASVKVMSLFATFTSLYQSYISKIPKALQPFFLQFIVAEMVQFSPAQALQCFYKSLSYAYGDYEQFYAEFYKVIERDIEQLWPISIIANSIVDRLPLDQTNQEYVSEAMDKHSFQELEKYTQHLGAMAQIFNALNQQQSSSKLSFQEFHLFLAAVKGNHLTQGLCFNVKQPLKGYSLLFDQIRNDQETIVKNIQNLSRIYSQKGDLTPLKSQICKVMELYFDRFIVNQKVKLIFNHFHPYIITESCHKQFAVILHRIKECAQFIEYSPMELMEDLKDMFRQRNKHTNKVFKVEYGDRNQGLTQDSSEMKSYINYPWIGFDLQTRSQISTRAEQQSNMEKTKFIRKSFESNINFKQGQLIRAQNQIKAANKKENVSIQVIKKEHNDSPEEQQPKIEINLQSDAEQSSSQSQQTLEEQQEKWYKMSYSPHKNKFRSDRKYSKFNKILFQNTCCLIKQISQRSNLKYIAKHVCSSKINTVIFHAKVEHGDEVNLFEDVRGGEQLRTLRWIQTLGPIYVLRWIADIAAGICELEELGIYHADLYFRNTIKVSKGNGFCFKIIDFDKAFKVNQSGKRDKSYESTKNLLDFWLKFRFDGRNSRAPMNFFDCQSEISDQTGSSTAYNVKDIINYIFYGADEHLINELLAIKRESVFSSNRLGKCFKLLRQHMRDSHLKQYSALVQQLLRTEEKEGYQEFTNPHFVSGIMEKLEMLKQGEIDYTQFAEQVRIIGGVEMEEEIDE